VRSRRGYPEEPLGRMMAAADAANLIERLESRRSHPKAAAVPEFGQAAAAPHSQVTTAWDASRRLGTLQRGQP